MCACEDGKAAWLTVSTLMVLRINAENGDDDTKIVPAERYKTAVAVQCLFVRRLHEDTEVGEMFASLLSVAARVLYSALAVHV